MSILIPLPVSLDSWDTVTTVKNVIMVITIENTTRIVDQNVKDVWPLIPVWTKDKNECIVLFVDALLSVLPVTNNI
jgi:hypothetical protein